MRTCCKRIAIFEVTSCYRPPFIYVTDALTFVLYFELKTVSYDMLQNGSLFQLLLLVLICIFFFKPLEQRGFVTLLASSVAISGVNFRFEICRTGQSHQYSVMCDT